VKTGRWWSRSYRLSHRSDQGCIFLSPDNRCRIHERFGPDAKPLACRLFPFLLVPTGDHLRVGIRYACPSGAENRGRPLSEHLADLTRLAGQFEKHQGIEKKALPPPPLQGRQRVDWPDLLRFADALAGLLADRRDRLERRLRKCLQLTHLCRQARFDSVRGKRLDEFLEVLAKTLDNDVPASPADLPAPGWIGRILLRQLVAMYGRKDRGKQIGLARQGRIALLRSGSRFALGQGLVPRINTLIGTVTFAEVEATAGELPLVAEAVLERYYLVKVSSMQFCGPTNFHLPLWDGLESLALTYPMVVWLARAMRPAPLEQAIVNALSIVDDHFGYNPILRRARYQLPRQILAAQGELPRLVAWYSR
jgi:lysine-N-methylase